MIDRIERMKKAQAKVKVKATTKAQAKVRAKRAWDLERKDCEMKCGKVRQCRVKEEEERPCGRVDDIENPVQFSIPRLTLEEEHARMIELCEQFPNERAMHVHPLLRKLEDVEDSFKHSTYYLEEQMVRKQDDKIVYSPMKVHPSLQKLDDGKNGFMYFTRYMGGQAIRKHDEKLIYSPKNVYLMDEDDLRREILKRHAKSITL